MKDRQNETGNAPETGSVPGYDALRYVEGVNRAVSRIGGLSKAALAAAAIVAVASVAIALRHTAEQSRYVWVLDQDSAIRAERQERSAQRDKEVIYHVQRFHERFYNLAPNMETINENIGEALGMADASVLRMDNTRREKMFYSTLVKNTMVQEIHMDSIKVDVNAYPYRARYWGHLYIIRSTTVSEYLFESSCRLINVPQSSTNLSGLLIEQFAEKKPELVRTGNRN